MPPESKITVNALIAATAVDGVWSDTQRENVLGVACALSEATGLTLADYRRAEEVIGRLIREAESRGFSAQDVQDLLAYQKACQERYAALQAETRTSVYEIASTQLDASADGAPAVQSLDDLLALCRVPDVVALAAYINGLQSQLAAANTRAEIAQRHAALSISQAQEAHATLAGIEKSVKDACEKLGLPDLAACLEHVHKNIHDTIRLQTELAEVTSVMQQQADVMQQQAITLGVYSGLQYRLDSLLDRNARLSKQLLRAQELNHLLERERHQASSVIVSSVMSDQAHLMGASTSSVYTLTEAMQIIDASTKFFEDLRMEAIVMSPLDVRDTLRNLHIDIDIPDAELLRMAEQIQGLDPAMVMESCNKIRIHTGQKPLLMVLPRCFVRTASASKNTAQYYNEHGQRTGYLRGQPVSFSAINQMRLVNQVQKTLPYKRIQLSERSDLQYFSGKPRGHLIACGLDAVRGIDMKSVSFAEQIAARTSLMGDNYAVTTDIIPAMNLDYFMLRDCRPSVYNLRLDGAEVDDRYLVYNPHTRYMFSMVNHHALHTVARIGAMKEFLPQS